MKTWSAFAIALIALANLFCNWHCQPACAQADPAVVSQNLVLKANELAKKGDNKGALEAFSEALRLDPRSAYAYKQRAELKNSLKDYFGALSDLDAVCFLTPADSNALSFRAEVKERLGNPFAALRDCDEALRIDPDERVARYNRAHLLGVRGLKQEMKSLIEDCNYLISRADSDMGMSYTMRGTAKRELGDLKGSIADAKLAMAAGDKSYWTWWNLAVGQADAGNYDDAFRALAEGAKAKPDGSKMFRDTGSILAGRGLDLEAVSVFERALKANPKDFEAWLQLGMAQSSMGNGPRAEASFRKALEIDPDDVAALLNLGDAKRQQRKYDDARKTFERANQLSPNSAAEYLALLDAKNPEDTPAFSGSYETVFDIDGRDTPATMTIEYVDRGVYRVFWKCMSGERCEGVGMRGSSDVMGIAYETLAKNLGVMILRWKDNNRFALVTGTDKKLSGHVVKRWISSKKTPSENPPAESPEPNVCGSYLVFRILSKDKRDDGVVTITKDSEAYNVKWRFDSGKTFAGPAVLSGQFLAATYDLNGFPVIMIYTVGGNSALRGSWASPGFKSAYVETGFKKK